MDTHLFDIEKDGITYEIHCFHGTWFAIEIEDEDKRYGPYKSYSQLAKELFVKD